MKYKAALFDYDGTIVDSNGVIVASWNYMCNKFIGHQLPEEMLVKTFGLPLLDAFRAVADEYGLEVTDDLLKEMDKAYTGYQYEHTLQGYPTFDGMIDLIKRLHAEGVKLAIVTSRRKKSLYEGLERYGILDCFDSIICDESTNIHKPEAEPALLACRGCNVDPKDALMIGDSRFDIACGNNAGCSSCFVNWSFSNTREQVEEFSPATYYVDNAEEIFNIII
ncbi:MAG: HAD family hydrolase [Bacillota bacterium]|nr:HAD family hydrolase [Bacillota bacterium]